MGPGNLPLPQPHYQPSNPQHCRLCHSPCPRHTDTSPFSSIIKLKIPLTYFFFFFNCCTFALASPLPFPLICCHPGPAYPSGSNISITFSVKCSLPPSPEATVFINFLPTFKHSVYVFGRALNIIHFFISFYVSPAPEWEFLD